MPVLPPNPLVNSTAGDIIKDALYELGVLAQGEEIQADDADFCMRKLNRLLDSFSSRGAMIFNVNFTTYALKPGKQAHTIGPGGDFDCALRPTKIVAANLVLNNAAPNVTIPIGIRDDAWWAQNRVQGLSSTYPTDIYYSPDFPLGHVNFWPIPQAAYGVQLETWVPFTQVRALVDPISYPQGYWDAIVYSLAVTLAPSFERTPDNILLGAMNRALGNVQGNNSSSPRISLTDAGVPGAAKNGGHFDWRTGGIR